MLGMSRTGRLPGFLGLAIVLTGSFTHGCATEPPVPVKIGPDGVVDIDNSRWKVLTSEGNIDGRTVEIHRMANGHYVAKLVDTGRLLGGTVGAYPGAVVMDFVPAKGVNVYVGAFTPVGGEAMDATFSIAANGQEPKSNREDYPWVRQP
jgi:hypothetical protein